MQLKIRHHNSGFGGSWFLDRVEVFCQDTKTIFPCQKWFGDNEDDGKIERTLIPIDQVLKSNHKPRTSDFLLLYFSRLAYLSFL